MLVFVRINWYRPDTYRFELNDVLNFIDLEKFEMSHMKHTCPNPHSGEKLHSQPREGAIFDIASKRGLWVTAVEYDSMKVFNDEMVEVSARQLGPNILEKYAGHIAGKQYGI